MAQTKTDFAQRALNMAATLASASDNLELLTKVYQARGYVFTQADCDPLGITLEDLTDTFNVITRFGQWVNGQAVTPTDNRTVLNKVRTDL